MRFADIPFKCDCGSDFELPVPLEQHLKEENVWLPDLLSQGILDYFSQSTNSCPSPDQSGHVSCVYAALPMFSTDPRVRKIISESCAMFNFNPLPVLHNSIALLLFSLFNYACASKEGQELTFRQLMNKMNENPQGIKHVKHDNELAESEALVQVNEWFLTSIASFIAHDDVDLK